MPNRSAQCDQRPRSDLSRPLKEIHVARLADRPAEIQIAVPHAVMTVNIAPMPIRAIQKTLAVAGLIGIELSAFQKRHRGDGFEHRTGRDRHARRPMKKRPPGIGRDRLPLLRRGVL